MLVNVLVWHDLSLQLSRRVVAVVATGRFLRGIIHKAVRQDTLQAVARDLAGREGMIVDQTSNSINQVKAGSIKAYAVSDHKRLAGAPDVPTADEAGLPAFHVAVWNAFWLPKGTPKDVTAKLSTAVMDALADPTVRKRLSDLGLDIPAPAQQTPEALGKYHKAEIEKWWPIIKATGIKAE